MAQRAQLQRQVGHKPLGGTLLTRECHGLADKRLGKTDRRRHLDVRLRACPHDRDAAAEKKCGDVDQHENRQKLHAQ